MGRPRMLTLGLAAWLVVGCGSTTPSADPATSVATYRGNAARTGVMPGPGPTGTPAVAWDFAAEGPFSNSPVIADGIVYAVSGEGRVHAIELATGTERWAADTTGFVGSSPMLAGDLVIVGDDHGTVQAFAAKDGTSAWTASVDGAVSGSPAPVGDDLIVATMGRHAYRLDAATGTTVWSVDVGGPTSRSVTADADTAYLPVETEIVAVALDDGTIRWRTTVAASGSAGTPSVAGDLLYGATAIDGEPADNGVVVLDKATGTERWRYHSPTDAQVYTPSIADGRAFIVGHDREVRALDATTGSPIWTATFDHDVEALPAVVGDTVYAVANDGPATALDAATGAIRWQVPIQGVPYAPALVDGYLVVGTTVGHLYAIHGS